MPGEGPELLHFVRLLPAAGLVPPSAALDCRKCNGVICSAAAAAGVIHDGLRDKGDACCVGVEYKPPSLIVSVSMLTENCVLSLPRVHSEEMFCQPRDEPHCRGEDMFQPKRVVVDTTIGVNGRLGTQIKCSMLLFDSSHQFWMILFVLSRSRCLTSGLEPSCRRSRSSSME